MNNKALTLIIALVAIFVIGGQSVYVVHQTQKAIVLQLGEPVGEVAGPGLHFKLPFIQNVIYFDSRVLDYDARSAEALTSDKKTIVLDNYARWRITDPLLFYRTVRTIPGAQMRLDDTVYSQLRVHVGQHTLTEVVSGERAEIMEEVTKRASESMAEYGMEIIDVRIKRTDLPAENQRAIFDRMRAERERQATQYRSEGREESTKIRSASDRERAVLLAEANKQSETIRGEGDAEAARTFAQAYTQSPEFFEFMRGLEALQKSFEGGGKFILTPETPLIKPLYQ
ncbi:MAG: protease modulator HflC [Pseudomonadota bacterium]